MSYSLEYIAAYTQNIKQTLNPSVDRGYLKAVSI